ncbi:hypothetical protein ACFFGT_10275 [Mucilaginibacter angelicae]|uniref:Uncharacterized protein n=1 Tax=Mucilaginibacter angelicae TaxID=869718 RepID=A0ABV6L586_9SPHI
MRINIRLSTGISLFTISGSGKQDQNPFQRTAPADSTGNGKRTAAVDYPIKSPDVPQSRNLQSINYMADEAPSAGAGDSGTSNQEQTFQVENGATAVIPAIGLTKLAGPARSAAAKQTEGLYRKNLPDGPITGMDNYTLTKDRTTLVELTGEAGGLTDKPNEVNIKIIRGDQQRPQVTEINLKDIRLTNVHPAFIPSGEAVYIPQSKGVIRNDKLQNRSVITRPVLLLLTTALIIFTLSHR